MFPLSLNVGAVVSVWHNTTILCLQAITSVVLRAPHLLLLPPELMKSHIESLALLLQVRGALAAQTHSMHQSIAYKTSSSQNNINTHIQATAEGAAVLCADQPSLLTARPEVLRERFESLSKVLDLSEDKMRALIGERPILLTKQSAYVREAIEEARRQGNL